MILIGRSTSVVFPFHSSKLKIPFRISNIGQKIISYIGPYIWNSSPNSIKKANSLNTFKHHAKKHYLTWIMHIVYMWICIYICLFVRVYIYIWIYISVFSFNLSILMFLFFFSFTLFSYFRSGLRDQNENMAFQPVLCYPRHCWCYSHMSAVIFQLQLMF